jgi:predicted permease
MQLRHVIRRLWQFPVFTGVAVLTLAIGIGANSALFGIVDNVLLKPLPYPNADELVALDHTAPGLNIQNAGQAPFLHFTYVDDARTFDRVGIWRLDTSSVTGVGAPEEVRTVRVSEGVLRCLGVAPMLGRSFTTSDDSPGGAETVILMAGYWHTRFGGDPNVVGTRIILDGTSRDIIGVMPDSFRFLDRQAALLVPLRLDRTQTRLGNFSFSGMARLRAGATVTQANADAARMIPLAMQRFPTFPGFSMKVFEGARLGPMVRPLKQAVVGDVGRVLWVLTGTIGLVLLIACANVANLVLVRADGRQHELAIRSALGAGPGRIAYELLVESVTLGAFGGIVGLALAYGALRVLLWLAPAGLPRLGEITLDARVALFTLVVSMAAGLLFGSVPVFRHTGSRLTTALRDDRTKSAGRDRHVARSLLVVVQVALALVLLVASGLMIRTFEALRHVPPGFSAPEELQTFRLSIPSSQVQENEAAVRMAQAIGDRISVIPGVTSAAMTSFVPMTGSGWHDPIFTADEDASESRIPPIRTFRQISPGFFATMGGSIVAGRDFTWSDLYQGHTVAIVSENLARELWGAPHAAIGKRVRETLASPWREVVGVVTDERDDGVDHKAPTIVFWPMLMSAFEGDKHWALRNVSYIVRSRRTGSSRFASEIEQAVWSVNSNLPLANVRTMREIYDASLARTSFALVLLGVSGGMALLLGLAGMYAVMSYTVSQRTREIGIRIALGAKSGEVTRLFIVYGASLAAIGIACGLGAALALVRAMSSLLFEVSPMDPLTYGAVSSSLLVVAGLASYLPARRVLSIDPVEALRSA